MNRSTVLTFAACTAALALSGLQAASASATCRSVKTNEPSNYNSRNFLAYCQTEELGKNGYSKIRSTEALEVTPGVWCYRVQSATDLSTFENPDCTGSTSEGGYFRSKEAPPKFWTLYSKLGKIKALNKGNHTFTLAGEKKSSAKNQKLPEAIWNKKPSR
jgi:hypothetical protein